MDYLTDVSLLSIMQEGFGFAFDNAIIVNAT